MSNIDKYEFIVNLSRDFITLINKDYVYEVVNDTYCNILGKKKKEVLGKSVAKIWGDERFKSTIKKRLDLCFSGEEVHYIESFKFGLDQKYMHVSFYPYGEEGSISHALVFSHDITKLGKIESKLINYEYRDPLTGLFNRRSLDIILDMELEKARRSKSEKLRALLFISINNLSNVNRKYGHDIGSILLENTGIRIKELLRDSDYVFRFEGNDLAVILSNVARESDAAKVAEKIIEDIATPYTHGVFDISLESSIGISLYPDDADSKEKMIAAAVSAMEAAVDSKEHYAIYDEGTHLISMVRLKMESDLHRAFQGNQFELFYQPIMDTSLTIQGAEALIRWHHPDKGLVNPGDFIPIAEETGIIDSIGKWALFSAAKQLEEWTKSFEVYISINLSAREFRNDDLLEVITGALKNSGNLDPRFLKLEITESEGFLNPEWSIQKMEQLKEAGIELFIDDFGTGQSSLSYLKKLPAETIKIDRVFITDLAKSDDDRDFLEKIIGILKCKKKRIIIEGVGSEDDFTILKEMGCDGFQGFHFAKPLPAPDFLLLLEKQGKKVP